MFFIVCIPHCQFYRSPNDECVFNKLKACDACLKLRLDQFNQCVEEFVEPNAAMSLPHDHI